MRGQIDIWYDIPNLTDRGGEDFIASWGIGSGTQTDAMFDTDGFDACDDDCFVYFNPCHVNIGLPGLDRHDFYKTSG